MSSSSNDIFIINNYTGSIYTSSPIERSSKKNISI